MTPYALVLGLINIISSRSSKTHLWKNSLKSENAFFSFYNITLRTFEIVLQLERDFAMISKLIIFDFDENFEYLIENMRRSNIFKGYEILNPIWCRNWKWFIRPEIIYKILLILQHFRDLIVENSKIYFLIFFVAMLYAILNLRIRYHYTKHIIGLSIIYQTVLSPRFKLSARKSVIFVSINICLEI